MNFQNNLYTVISATNNGATSVSYQIGLNPESVIFKAHFPGEPIMPGACIVQIVLELFSAWRGREAEIIKVKNLKFLSVISPDEVSALEVHIEIKKEEADTLQVKADVVKDETEYTMMSLLIREIE